MASNKQIKNYYDFLDRLIALLPGHVYWLDCNSVYQGCNELQAQSAGLSSRAEIIGKKNQDLPWLKDCHAVIDMIERNNNLVIQSGIPHVFEEPAGSRDGKELIFLSHKVPLCDENKNVMGILGISLDITTRKKLESELQANKEETEIALENIIAWLPGHVFWLDKAGVFLGCNDLQALSAGYSSRNDMVGKTVYDFLPKEQADNIYRINKQVMQTGLPHTVEEPGSYGNKEAIFLSQKAPLRNKSNQIIGIVGIAFDVTDLREVEKKLYESEHKLVEGLTLVGASAAHELRTPLAAISLGVENLKKIFPHLIHGYQLAKQANLPVYEFSDTYFKLIESELASIESETRGAFTFIDMLLMKLDLSFENSTQENFSVSLCVNEALARYPFQSNERQLIRWEAGDDFMVKGTMLLVIHVLFNLLKNALYYVIKSGKNDAVITIGLEPGSQFNRLHFKDTGTGMAADVLPHIFERFFSKTLHGAGIGLAFCKHVMESLGGSITCESVENDYSHFILKFPAHNA